MIAMSELLQTQQIETLERMAAQSRNTAVRRRARVLLLYQRGQSTRAIADTVGLSPNRVRHWRRQFLSKGMGIFPDSLMPSLQPTTTPTMPDAAHDGSIFENQRPRQGASFGEAAAGT